MRWARIVLKMGGVLATTILAFLSVGGVAGQDVQSQIIQTSEAHIEVRSKGSGRSLVVLSGVGAEVSYLDPFVSAVADEGLRVLAINPRGAGASRGPMVGLTLHDYASDVAAILDLLQVDSATILGFGGGNRVARMLAVDRPELVDGLVLVAAGGLVPGDSTATAQMEFWARQDGAPDELHRAFSESMLSPSTDASGFPAPVVVPDAFKAQMAALRGTPTEEWWSGGVAEILVLQGADDLIAPPGNGSALREEFPDRVRLVTVPRAGHMLLMERPDFVADRLIEFIGRSR